MKLNVESIFNSIDGEANGFLGAGELTTFIRLRGCNLRCFYCDTAYAQNADVKEEMTVDDIRAFQGLLPKITITGGEPLIQPGAKKLIYCLVRDGHQVSVETNGSIPITPLLNGKKGKVASRERIASSKLFENNLRYVVDYKLPSSGVEAEMKKEVFDGLRCVDVIKFVIADYSDYYVARGLVVGNKHWRARKVFSPAIVDQSDYTGWPATLAELMIADHEVLSSVQYSLQVHKVLWPNALIER